MICTKWYQAFLIFNVLLIFSYVWFRLVTFVRKCSNFFTFAIDFSGTFMLQWVVYIIHEHFFLVVK